MPFHKVCVQVLASFPTVVLANVHPGKQQLRIAQAAASLPSMWETWMEFLAHSFSLDQPYLLKVSAVNPQMRILCFSLSTYLIYFVALFVYGH